VLCALLTILIARAGLKDYATTWATLGPVELSNPGSAALFAPMTMLTLLLLTANKGDDNAKYLQTPTLHGVIWTTLGLALFMTPNCRGVTDAGLLENCISKRPASTLIYYALSLGLSILLLTALMIVIDLR
jgi:hypothetical protein